MRSFSTSGFSLIELLIATLILGVSLVPAMQALQGSQQAGQIQQDSVGQHYALVAKMEEVLAEPFSALVAEAAVTNLADSSNLYSDPAVIVGADLDRRLVYLSHYDADNADADNDPFTGVEADTIWLRVAFEKSDLFFETVTSE